MMFELKASSFKVIFLEMHQDFLEMHQDFGVKNLAVFRDSELSAYVSFSVCGQEQKGQLLEPLLPIPSPCLVPILLGRIRNSQQ